MQSLYGSFAAPHGKRSFFRQKNWREQVALSMERYLCTMNSRTAEAARGQPDARRVYTRNKDFLRPPPVASETTPLHHDPALRPPRLDP